MNPQPFLVGTKLRIKDDTELWELVGYKGDMMLLKALNNDALYQKDTTYPDVMKIAIEKGYKPDPNATFQLHYKYADRYDVV